MKLKSVISGSDGARKGFHHLTPSVLQHSQVDPHVPQILWIEYQDDGKGGLSLRGVAFMTVLAVLTVLESTLPSFCLSHKIQRQETTVTVLTVLAVSVVVAVLVVTATPLKLNPPFSSS